MSATGRASERGATLLEMLVVVAILGLMTGLVFSNVLRPLDRMSLLRSRAVLVANLRSARATSAKLGRSVRLDLAEDGRGYGWEGARVALAPPLRLEGEPREIVFFPDGSSNGGDLKLTGRSRSLEVAIDAATGVVAAEGPA